MRIFVCISSHFIRRYDTRREKRLEGRERDARERETRDEVMTIEGNSGFGVRSQEVKGIGEGLTRENLARCATVLLHQGSSTSCRHSVRRRRALARWSGSGNGGSSGSFRGDSS